MTVRHQTVLCCFHNLNCECRCLTDSVCGFVAIVCARPVLRKAPFMVGGGGARRPRHHSARESQNARRLARPGAARGGNRRAIVDCGHAPVAMQRHWCRFALVAVCAAGGLGGVLIVERRRP